MSLKGKYEWRLGEDLPFLEPHSRTKHEVIRTYLREYLRIVAARPQQDYLKIAFVDGFCGGGLYRTTSGEPNAPGSPLILLEEVDSVGRAINEERRKPLEIRSQYYFVDESAGAIEHLESVLRERGFRDRIGQSIFPLHAEFHTCFPQILAQILSAGKSQRCIFLLDQYGYSAISFDVIRKIFSTLSNPEVLLTFNVDNLIRYLSDTPAFLKAVADIDIDERRIQDMINLKNGAGWRYVIQNALYEHVVERTGAKYYTCFFIKSSASHEAYWFLHLSTHPRARDEMAKRHWALSNSFAHHGGVGLNMLGFDPDIDPDQITMDFIFNTSDEARVMKALEYDLPEIIFNRSSSGSGPLTFKGLFGGVCNTTPATKEMVATKLLELREGREIQLLKPDGRDKPRAMKIGWEDQITIPSQGILFSQMKRPKN